MVPKRLITTWICTPEQDRYQERHREMLGHCVASWLRVMPDYELEVVTLGTILADHEAARTPWLQERLTEGNWIAVSHWARLVWLHRHGGVYLDADVEAVARFDLLREDLFTVGHLGNGQAFANNAVVASAPGHPVLATWLTATMQGPHENPEFGNLSGPFLLTNILNTAGWDGADREVELLWRAPSGLDWPLRVRRSAVFYPYTWHQAYTAACHQHDTLAVHHWGSAWRTPEQQPQQQWRSHVA